MHMLQDSDASCSQMLLGKLSAGDVSQTTAKKKKNLRYYRKCVVTEKMVCVHFSLCLLSKHLKKKLHLPRANDVMFLVSHWLVGILHPHCI